MSLKVRLVFNKQEEEYISDFCRQIGLPLEKFCRQAVFYSIQESYKRAEQLAEKQSKELQNVIHDPVPTDVAGISEPTPSNETPVRDALPDQADVGNQG